MPGTKEQSSYLLKHPVAARKTVYKKFAKSSQLYIILFIPLLYLIIFKYAPMYGIQLAFKSFLPLKGIWGSPWIGLANFEKFFHSHMFWTVLKNTLGISIYSLIAGFPVPIIIALSLNNTENVVFKKTVQMVTYAPHFISTVVMVGMILQFLSPRYGIINTVLQNVFHLQPVSFMGKPEYFQSIYVWTNIWQHAGWGTIIYLAALSSIDPMLHEAAIVDGASKLKRTFYIDIPGILPTVVTLLILDVGKIMDVGFEKVFLMQNALNLQSSEIISTYVYKLSIGSTMPDYSFSTAIGLFNSLINFILIVLVNAIAKKMNQTSLW